MHVTKTSGSSRPKVSIITTVYNAEKYLCECLDSALKQDLHDIEIVCIDGNSTDKTLQIIARYMEKDSRVKLYFQTKKGIGAAKNCGIEKSCGEYITFLDADDFYVDRTALHRMYQTCIKHKVKVCGAFRSTLYMDGNIINEPLHRKDCKSMPEGTKYLYKDRPYDYHFHSYIYDRNMITKNHIQFAETLAYDDTHFFIRAMLAAKEFSLVPVELYRYRCGPAYDWGMEKANDALDALTDQLILTKANHLDWLHWLTVQRINYEYEEIFTRNILQGDYLLLEKLVRTNQEISSDIVSRVQKNPPPQSWYVDPMIHRNINDMPLRESVNAYMPTYVLEPLWKVIFSQGYENYITQKQNTELKKYVEILENSYAFRIGRIFTYFPRKIRQLIKPN